MNTRLLAKSIRWPTLASLVPRPLLNSSSASACSGPNHQDVTSSWGAFIRFLRGMSTIERIYELHTERERTRRDAWRSSRLWCWLIIFLWGANKLKKQAWWCFHPCRALTKASDFIPVVGARRSAGLNTVHASLARWFKPVYIFAMLADRSEWFFESRHGILSSARSYMSPDSLFWYLSVKNRYRQIFGFNRAILRAKWRTIHSSSGRRRLALRNTAQLAYGWHSSLPWPEGSLWNDFSPCVICCHLRTNLLRSITALGEQSKRRVSFASVLAKPNAFYSTLSEPDRRRECKAFIGGFHATRPGWCPNYGPTVLPRPSWVGWSPGKQSKMHKLNISRLSQQSSNFGVPAISTPWWTFLVIS